MIVHITDRPQNKPVTRERIANTNDIGVAYCFGAKEHRSARSTRPEDLDDASAVICTMSSYRGEWEQEWLGLAYEYKQRWPARKLIIYQEKEAHWAQSRPWDEQKSFYRTIQACDLFLTHNTADEPMYKLMCRHDRVYYFPPVQDLDVIRGIRRIPSTEKKVAVAAYHQRWNGIQAALICKEMGYPIVATKVGVFTDGRDQQLPEIFDLPVVSKLSYQNWNGWAHGLSQCWAYLHPLSVASAGRDQVACALIGVPIIGNCFSTAQEVLWPLLRVEPLNIEACKAALRELEEPRFYQHCVEIAADRVEQFDLPFCVSLARQMIEQLGWQWEWNSD